MATIDFEKNKPLNEEDIPKKDAYTLGREMAQAWEPPELKNMYLTFGMVPTAMFSMLMSSRSPMDLGLRLSPEIDLGRLMNPALKVKYAGFVIDFPYVDERRRCFIQLVKNPVLGVEELPAPCVGILNRKIYTSTKDLYSDLEAQGYQLNDLQDMTTRSAFLEEIAGYNKDVHKIFEPSLIFQLCCAWSLDQWMEHYLPLA